MKIFVAMPENYETETFMTRGNREYLESLGEVTWSKLDRYMTADEFKEALADTDVLVTAWGTPKLTAEVLEKANKLKLVAYCAGSVANVVSDEMYDRGIRIVSGNEAFAISVAEGTIAYTLSMLRRLNEYECRTVEGGWITGMTAKTESLLGKTVGIVGFGAISRHLLTMLKPFKVQIKLFSNHTTEEEAAKLGVQKADLEEIFSTCDIVSLHCARSEKNYHLINDRLLSMMRQDALLVNTSRGDVVDEDALVKHLQSGHIRASLDVYTQEPLPADHPLRALGHQVNLQSHKAGPTVDYRHAAARLVFDDIARMQKGEDLENEIKPWRAQMMTK